MHRNGIVLIIIASFLLTGCASKGNLESQQEHKPQFVDVRLVDGPVDKASAMIDADPDEVICKREKIVGSLFYKTVCKTRRQIEAERRSAQDALRRNQERNAASFMRR